MWWSVAVTVLVLDPFWFLSLSLFVMVFFAQVEGGEILAHRVILIINSEYFRSMFRDGFHETHIREIPIPSESVDRRSAETLVDFMYTGQFSG